MTPALLSISVMALAAMTSALAIWAVRPLLMRYAMARPNARSSHRTPTPQGAGIAVIAATLLVAGAIIAGTGFQSAEIPITVFCATLFLALIGAIDDIKAIPVVLRLVLQALAVGAVLAAIPGETGIIPYCPIWIERCAFLLAGLWFVNLVNFMDGLDWMTVAEVVPVTAALVLLGTADEFSPSAAIVAAALCGAMLGFAPYNRPVAKIFLGDVGSLPVGLLLGWFLLDLAAHQHLTAAILLPLYYLIDATLTLVRQRVSGKPVWLAHREHYYQQATDNGWSVLRVVTCVFSVNIFLAALAWLSIELRSSIADAALLAAGVIAVAVLLARFSSPR